MNKIPIRHIVAEPNETPHTGGFQIRRVENLVSQKDMVQSLHRHSFFYMLVLKKARGRHRIDFIEYPVNPHTIFFMRPGQVHELILKKGSVGYLISFSQSFYAPQEKANSEVLRKIRHRNHFPLVANQFTKLLNILNNINEEYENRDAYYEDMIRSGMNQFFIELLRQSTNLQPMKMDESYQQGRLEELQDLLQQHLNEHKQVAFYAAQLHLTQYQLNVITKVTLGKNCSVVIKDAIILEAKRQLLATSGQINEVAGALGYEDVSYFIRFFKKHTSYTPDAFRHNFK